MIFREIKFRFNIKFIFIKFIRGIIQNIFNRFGLKIVHFNNILIDINHLINKKDELIILDVGAYTGNSIYEFNKYFSRSKIYSFEPSLKNFELLKKNTAKIDNCELINKAVTNNDGEITFYENSWGPTSSTKILNENSNKKYYDDKFKYLGLNKINKTYKINTIKIDTFLNQKKIINIDILKIDTQGNEYEVLLGSEILIQKNNVEFIIIEMIIDNYYKSESNLGKVDNLLSSYGYELYGFYDILKQPKRQIHQFDAMYVLKSKNAL